MKKTGPKKIAPFLHQAFAITVIIFILANLPGPAVFTKPTPVEAGGIFGIFGEGSITSLILDAILQVVKMAIIHRIQALLHDFLASISTVCPDYLRYIGTDICERVIGDWRGAIDNAVDQALHQTMTEVAAISAPPEFITALLAAVPHRSYLSAAAYTLDGTVASRGGGTHADFFSDMSTHGGFDALMAMFLPQNNLIGQSLLLQQERISNIGADVQATEQANTNASLADYDCAVPDPAGPDGCSINGWVQRVDPQLKDAATDKISLADFEDIINLESLGRIIGAALSTWVESFLFSGLTGSPPPPPGSSCTGLTGDALIVCECQVSSGGDPTLYRACLDSRLPPIFTYYTVSPASLSSSTGGVVIVDWGTSSIASGCIAEGAWSGSRPTSGTESTFISPPVLVPALTYSMTCSDRFGRSETRSGTVTVTP